MEHDQSGLLVLAALRADAATAHIPVLLCSADVEALLSFAATNQKPHTATLAKPFDLTELLSALTLINPVLRPLTPP